jgi:hypothetical protein
MYADICYRKVLQNLSKLRLFVRKYTIWQPSLNGRVQTFETVPPNLLLTMVMSMP